jgi:hypothetical protein
MSNWRLQLIMPEAGTLKNMEEGGGPQKLDNVISSKSARKERS